MIQGFNEQTQPLTEYEEQTLMPIFTHCLSSKVGKGMAVTNQYIVERMKKCGYKITDARVRKIINYIRVHDLVPCLVATSAGYYIATNEQELIDYEYSLQSREDAISAVRMAIERQRIRTYNSCEA